MVTVRRWYIFLISAVSLQAITWALVSLLSRLPPSQLRAPAGAVAIEIALVVVCLPFFLVHWLWAQRLARSDKEERASLLRRSYLYSMQAIFVAGFAISAYNLLQALLRFVLREPPPAFGSPPGSTAELVQDAIAGLLVTGVAWLYNRRVIQQDAGAAPDSGVLGAVRRLYVLSFAAAGLFVLAFSVTTALMWVVHHIIIRPGVDSMDAGLSGGIARLIVGLSLWLWFWMRAQVLFHGDNPDEHESLLRKVYLYLAVSTSALTAVGILSFILADLFRRAMGVATDVDLRDPPLILLVAGIIWVYHTLVLRDDARRTVEVPEQALIRRLYFYLVGAIGLAAFLIGLAGDVSVIILSLAGQVFGTGPQEQVAIFTAGLAVGLPVWLLPWRFAQQAALALTASGQAERRSIVRKLYLYFYIFAASMMVLFGLVYVLYTLLTLALGGTVTGNLVSELAQPIAYSLIAIGVWLYHGQALRGDGRLARAEKAERLASLRVAVVDGGDGQWGCSLLEALRRELPGLGLIPIGLTPAAASAMGMSGREGSVEKFAQGSSIVVGSWTAAVSGALTYPVGEALSSSPARKFLVPVAAPGWEWIGVENKTPAALIQETVKTLKRAIEGEEVSSRGSTGALIGGGVVLVMLLCVVARLIPMIAGFD
ncbi:MAG: DUF5671 domain-containing protein [Rudaea sp.]